MNKWIGLNGWYKLNQYLPSHSSTKSELWQPRALTGVQEGCFTQTLALATIHAFRKVENKKELPVSIKHNRKYRENNWHNSVADTYTFETHYAWNDLLRTKFCWQVLWYALSITFGDVTFGRRWVAKPAGRTPISLARRRARCHFTQKRQYPRKWLTKSADSGDNRVKKTKLCERRKMMRYAAPTIRLTLKESKDFEQWLRNFHCMRTYLYHSSIWKHVPAPCLQNRTTATNICFSF